MQKEDEWISVKDRLPSNERIGYVYDSEKKQIRTHIIFDRTDKIWIHINPLDFEIIVDSITHWIPYPKPPKEKNE